jgi:hypothetical protein
VLKRIDWSAPFTAWAVAALSFLARLPNTLAGLGFDGDSGLFVVQALLSVERHLYLPSRAPGYLVPDMVAQALAGHGPHWLCLLNSALYALSVPVFATILRELNLRRQGWLLIAYAFLPLGWVACSDVMVEYSLCLLGVLLGWLYTLRGAPLQAGLWLGIGAAMRPSQGVIIYLIFVAHWILVWGKPRGLVTTGIGLMSLLALWAVPVGALTGRWQILWSYLPYEASWQQHLLRAGSRIIGACGIIGLVACALIALNILAQLRKLRVFTSPNILCLAVVGAVLILFLRHPFKMNYLLLASPFGLVGAATLARPALVAFLSVALVLHNAVGIPSLGRLTTRHNSRLIGWGLAIRDYLERREFPLQVKRLVDQLPPRNVLGVQEATVWLLAYEALRGDRPDWQVNSPNEVVDAATQRYFVLVGDRDSFERWRPQKKPVYITTGVWVRLQRDFGYNDREAWFRIVETPNVGL